MAAGHDTYQWGTYRYLSLNWRRTKAPFNLLQVCSFWRTIVQSTPTMWNSLTARSWRRYRPDMPELDHWLKNTGSAPLCLQFESDDNPERNDKCHQHSLMDIYATQGHRWESLCFDLSPSMTAKFSSILQDHKDTHGFPHLVRLELNFDTIRQPEQHVVEELATAISFIKSIRQIIWHHGSFEGHLNLPWNQLDVVYFIMPQSVKNVLSYMKQCSVASSITFRRFSTRDIVLDSEALPVSLPNLKSLDLMAQRCHNSFEPLNHVITPNLESLQIDILSLEPSVYNFLAQFLDTSKCTLKDITITEFCSPPNIIDVTKRFFELSLHSIPTVQLFNGYVHGAMLKLLQTRPEMRTHPRILAWTVSVRPRGVGWKDLTANDTLKFSWNDGKLNLCGTTDLLDEHDRLCL